MPVKMDVKLIACHMVEGARGLLVVLFDVLRIELEYDDSELVPWDQPAFRVNSEGF